MNVATAIASYEQLFLQCLFHVMMKHYTTLYTYVYSPQE